MTRLKLYAKPILENRFWILESNGEKIGTICKQEDRRYMFSCEQGTRLYDNQSQLEQSFTGDWFWGTTLSAPEIEQENTDNDVYDYQENLYNNLGCKGCHQIQEEPVEIPSYSREDIPPEFVG